MPVCFIYKSINFLTCIKLLYTKSSKQITKSAQNFIACCIAWNISYCNKKQGRGFLGVECNVSDIWQVFSVLHDSNWSWIVTSSLLQQLPEKKITISVFNSQTVLVLKQKFMRKLIHTKVIYYGRLIGPWRKKIKP